MADWLQHLELGYNALEHGSTLAADAHFLAAYEAAPDDPVACYAYARSLARVENWLEAEPLLKKAFSLDPALLDAACEWVRVKVILGVDFDMTLAFLDQLEACHRDEYLIPLTKIELFLRVGDEVRSSSALDSARKKGAPQEHLLVAQAKIEQLLGLKFVQTGDLERAQEQFILASELDTSWAAPHINRGVTQEKMGSPGDARESYLRGLELEPLSSVALYNLANLHARQKEAAEASRYMRVLLEVHPDYPGAQKLALEIVEMER
ncbi:tetratricopeptide repeat protein [Myxococcota bacterium]|nr:tetratricopeptide repeat protein [Myxococcota bacterium]